MTTGNLKQSANRYYLLLFAVAVFAYIAYRTLFLTMDRGDISLTVFQNSKPISHIDQKRTVSNQNTFHVDRLDFVGNKYSLTHKKLGNIGYHSNFFVDFTTTMVLDTDQKVMFGIYSDDGFNLIIDGQNILSYKKDRAIALDMKELELKAGEHSFKLEYYQGGGHLGVKAMYGIGEHKYVIGDDSKFVTFER